MEMVLILKMKLLNINAIIALFQKKIVVLLKALVSKQDKITNNNIYVLLGMKKYDLIS